jgi:tRNA(Ile)-lysidine synthase
MLRARCSVEAVLLEFLSARGVNATEPVSVAYSGGPDSAALLTALVGIGWERVIAVYVDHGLRPRSELEEEFKLVREVCARLKTRLVVARVRRGAIEERVKVRGDGVEAEARRYRYAALRRGSSMAGAKAILIAHTRDDQAETVLMRLFGGSGAGGLRGMPDSTGLFHRPFLGLGKADLLEYLRTYGIEYSSDSTNASCDFLRNRVRRDVVPALDAAIPGWRKGLTLAANKAARDEEALAKAAAELAIIPSGSGAGVSIPAEALLTASEAIAVRAIVRAAGEITGRPRFPSATAIAALKALRSGTRAHYRGAGLEFQALDGMVLLRRGLDFPRHDGYFVLIDRPLRIRVGSLDVRAVWRNGGRNGIRADAFSFPLVVRSRRAGDAIELKKGTKRLDELFSEWGLTEGARRRAPVVADRAGIVAVLGAELGGRDRYRHRPGSEGIDGGAAPLLSVFVKGA